MTVTVESPAGATKQCERCLRVRPLVLFPRPRAYSRHCQGCTDAELAAVHGTRCGSLSPTRFRVASVMAQQPGTWDVATIVHRASALVRKAKLRASWTGQPFALSTEWAADRLTHGLCEVTGLPFELNEGTRGAFSPSIDRARPELGYTAENSRMVVWIYNSAKGDGTHSDVLRMAFALVQRAVCPEGGHPDEPPVEAV